MSRSVMIIGVVWASCASLGLGIHAAAAAFPQFHFAIAIAGAIASVALGGLLGTLISGRLIRRPAPRRQVRSYCAFCWSPALDYEDDCFQCGSPAAIQVRVQV